MQKAVKRVKIDAPYELNYRPNEEKEKVFFVLSEAVTHTHTRTNSARVYALGHIGKQIGDADAETKAFARKFNAPAVYAGREVENV